MLELVNSGELTKLVTGGSELFIQSVLPFAANAKWPKHTLVSVDLERRANNRQANAEEVAMHEVLPDAVYVGADDVP